MTSDLTRNNLLLVQTMSNVMERSIEVLEIDAPTAVGATIHGADAAGLIIDCTKSVARCGALSLKLTRPRVENAAISIRLAAFWYSGGNIH